ncbi:MAG: hypothetical protein ACJ8GK_13755 [Luteimonas sp.]
MGMVVWAAGWFLGLALIPIVNASHLDMRLKAALNGILLLGFPKLFLILAIAILGKSGFTYLKSLVGSHFRRFAPPSTVSAGRYCTGLILLTAVLVLCSIGDYVAGGLIPMRHAHPRLVALAGDLLILLSFFLLGGEFWDKLRSLFVREAKAVFPQPKYGA